MDKNSGTVAGRGEGLAGAIELLRDQYQAMLDGKFDGATYIGQVAGIGREAEIVIKLVIAELTATLEAAAPPSTAQSELLCVNCGHSYAQHTKGINHPQKYCRHCPCLEWAALATPSPQAPAKPGLRELIEELTPMVDFYLKREIESPSNHQEFAREASEKLDKWYELASIVPPSPRSSAATQEQPAGSGASLLGMKPANRTLAEKAQDDDPGSPRKVGEDAPAGDEHRLLESDLVGWWGRCSCGWDCEFAGDWTKHLKSLRPSSAPVGEQKQEEGV